MFKLERNKKAGDIGRHFDKGAVITVAPAALLFFFKGCMHMSLMGQYGAK